MAQRTKQYTSKAKAARRAQRRMARRSRDVTDNWVPTTRHDLWALASPDPEDLKMLAEFFAEMGVNYVERH